MATSLRLRLLSSVFLATAWLTPLAWSSSHASPAPVQDPADQEPAGQEFPGQEIENPQGEDQPPGDEDDAPARGRRGRSRGAAKKARRSTRGASDRGETAAKHGREAATAKEASATPEQIRRNQLAKLSPKEREQRAEAAGLKRWKQANPKLKPEVVTGEHFLFFSTLPRDRATATVKAMEAQYGHLRRLLGSPATDWVEKVGLYVFADRKDFVEFTRSVENREVEANVSSGGSLSVPSPYVVAVDPLGGKKEEPAAARRKARTRRGEEKEAAAGAGRSLLGLLTESLADATLAVQNKTPRWLSQGVGAYMAAHLEPRSPYYQKLREVARDKYNQGWPTRATEALGEASHASAEDVRAVGFAVVECLMSANYRQLFPAFVKGMEAGKEKLDDVVKEVYGATREDFLSITGDWVAERYGRDQ